MKVRLNVFIHETKKNIKSTNSQSEEYRQILNGKKYNSKYVMIVT